MDAATVRGSVAGVLACILLTWASAPGLLQAHETDQFTVPPGREVADVGPEFTRWVYEALERAVERTNRRIARATEGGASAKQLERLRSPKTIAFAFNGEFPNGYDVIEQWEKRNTSGETAGRYPGQVVAFKEFFNNSYKNVHLPVDPRRILRIWFSSSIKAFDVHIGHDKIGHFTDMGFRYYKQYLKTLESGGSEDEAVQAALRLGTDDFLLSESGVLGYISAGAYSNADLVANYVGLLLYRNVTEPVTLKGQQRPAMLVRDGLYWRIAPHVRPDSDFLSWYFSDHWDEALNPSLFRPWLQKPFRDAVRERCEYVLWRYRDANGCRRSPQDLQQKWVELTTYYGFDYGHRGEPSELIMPVNTAYEPLPADAPLDARCRRGYTPIHWAVLAGDGERLLELLRRGADPNERVVSDENWSSEWDNTPLHLAARDGRVAMARVLLDQGADVNAANELGATPLHCAYRHGDMAAMLLDRGAEPGARDTSGRTPLHYAAADDEADSRALALLLRAGADADARDARGRTPLHDAAEAGHGIAVAHLLDDTDLSATSELGVTALHLAAQSGDDAIVAMLIDAGADVDAGDNFGWTALHLAARYGRDEAGKVLASAGADVDRADPDGSSPLHLAARHRHSSVAGILLAAGADPSVVNAAGATPLHEAAFAGDPHIAEQLLAADGDLTRLSDSRGHVPADVARARGHKDLARQLSPDRLAVRSARR